MIPYIVIASNNPKKRNELVVGLGLPAVAVQTPDALVESGRADAPIPKPVEDADTYPENAAIKARAFAAWTGAVAVADDSGIEIDALDGRPGVRSARYAGADATDSDNVRKVLEELSDVPAHERTARFVCAIHVEDPDGASWSTTGTCEGHLTTGRQGGGGFGYDPIFIPNGYAQTFAELPAETKARISHRAVALEALRAEIRTGSLSRLANLRGIA